MTDVWEQWDHVWDLTGDSFWSQAACEAADKEPHSPQHLPGPIAFAGPIAFTVEAHRGASAVPASYTSPSISPSTCS